MEIIRTSRRWNFLEDSYYLKPSSGEECDHMIIAPMNVPNTDEIANQIAEGAFYGNHSLKKVILQKITSVEYVAFAYSSVEEVIFDGYDTEVPYLSIGEESFKHSKIKQIKLPDTEVELLYGCFEKCKLLEEVILPTSVREIPAWAFYGCQSLRRVIAPSVK